MKRRAFLPVAAVVVAFSLTGCASAPAKLAANETADLESCEQLTGSRIRNPQRTDCTSPGAMRFRSFSAEELRTTGETDLAEALRKLDPVFH